MPRGFSLSQPLPLKTEKVRDFFALLTFHMFQPYEVAGFPPLFPPQSFDHGFILFFVPKRNF